MTTLPLHECNGYLFLEIAGSPWLLDTGSPTSFGSGGGLTIDGERFELPPARGGLTAEGIAGYCGAPCAGLLGADVLGRFDHLWDLDGGRRPSLPRNSVSGETTSASTIASACRS